MDAERGRSAPSALARGILQRDQCDHADAWQDTKQHGLYKKK
jgi:hypothetical protein